MTERRKDSKGRILKEGEIQRKDGLYMFCYYDLSGKRKCVYAKNLPELREKETRIRRDLQDGIDTGKGDMTLNQLFRVYMETKSGLREATKCNYLSIWKNIIENTALGNMKIKNIKQVHVRALYSNMANGGYSANTIKLVHSILFPCFELAVDSDLIRKNPAKDCKKGIGGVKKERTAMSIDEQEKLLDFVKNSKRYSVYLPMLTFALSTALRVGELAGLRWSDVDFKQNVVHIRQQLVYKNFGSGCRFYFQPLKTDAGRRDIPMTATAKRSLLGQRELSMMLGKIVKVQEVDGISDFVFINSQGKPYAANAVNFMLDNVVKGCNKAETEMALKEHREPVLLPHISAHILRHTACTRFAESGLEPKVLQYIMGHANISVTMDTYTHLDWTKIQEKVDEIQESIKVG